MGLINIFFSLLIIYVTFKVTFTKPLQDDVSYIEKINFEHKDDKWICGDIQCPEKTYGCNIRLRTDTNDRKVLYQSFNCFDKEQNGLLGAGDIINLTKEKIIDIKLKSYDGAISLYSSSYGLSGHENADGVVAVEDLNALKEDFRKSKKIVLDSNAKK